MSKATASGVDFIAPMALFATLLTASVGPVISQPSCNPAIHLKHCAPPLLAAFAA
jgi:hypothetical protein